MSKVYAGRRGHHEATENQTALLPLGELGHRGRCEENPGFRQDCGHFGRTCFASGPSDEPEMLKRFGMCQDWPV